MRALSRGFGRQRRRCKLRLQPAACNGRQTASRAANITLNTHDGVTLGATYYGSLLGKEAVPVIMLHQYKGSRADFKDLALALQAKGCAVLVPDLRGHGQSTHQTEPGMPSRKSARRFCGSKISPP